MTNNVQQMFSGDNAFYNQPNYSKNTIGEMSSKKPPSDPIYTHTVENKIWRIVKNILSILFPPYGLARLAHSLTGIALLPACLLGAALVPENAHTVFGITSNYLNDIRRKAVCHLNPDEPENFFTAYSQKGWEVKRIAVEVDGYIIDGAIIGKKETLGNGRWLLASNGNGQFYEQHLFNGPIKDILTKVNGNAVVFNYPSVGSSSGLLPSRSAMEKSYAAMLNFLEDKEKGVGAKEIIGFGHSMGGGVQGDVLKTHELKKDIKYVFVKSMTFSNISTAATHIGNKLLGFLAKLFGWNISSIESSKNLQAPEIIIQHANVTEATDIKENPELLLDDQVIPAEATLAKNLLNDKDCPKENKYFMGVPEMHNSAYTRSTINHLGDKIEEFLTA